MTSEIDPPEPMREGTDDPYRKTPNFFPAELLREPTRVTDFENPRFRIINRVNDFGHTRNSECGVCAAVHSVTNRCGIM